MLLIESLPSADSIIVIWFKLLCLAGKTNNNGVFLMNDTLAYTDEMLGTIFRRDVNTIRLALDTFERFGMIEVIQGVITIPNWGKHQTLDKIEKKTEYMRKYMQDYRKKQAEQIECKTNSKTNSKSNCKANVSSLDKDIDKEVDIEKDKDNISGKRKRFIPPTLDEVQEYCRERNNNVDAESFIDYYASQKWKKANGRPVEDWKACVRTWEKNNFNRKEPKSQGSMMDKWDKALEEAKQLIGGNE